MGFIGFAIVIIFIGAICMLRMISKMKKRIEGELLSFADKGFGKIFVGDDGKSGIGANLDDYKLVLVELKGKEIFSNIIDYKDIVSVELVQNGTIVSKTSKSSQLGKAAVGGVLFGGAGAVIGALSGNKKNVENVSKVQAKLTIQDLKMPIFNVTFMDANFKKDGFFHKAMIQKAEEWIGIISAMIKKAEQDIIYQSQGSNTASNYVDEIERLHSLKEKGIITEEEFNKKKAELL
ncbi:MAG: SHOCT domain-containing protein [Fusobacteriaceae bacterium]